MTDREHAIQALVATAPPLRQEQRDRVAAVLRPTIEQRRSGRRRAA